MADPKTVEARLRVVEVQALDNVLKRNGGASR